MNIKPLLDLAAGAALLALTACGGGSSSTAPAAIAPVSLIAGVFDGQTASGQPLTAIVQDDGAFYFVYSDAAAPHGALGALIGKLSQSTAQDLNLNTGGAAPQTVQLTAKLNAATQSLSASYTYGASGQGNRFEANLNPAYATLPAIAALAGSYTGSIATPALSETSLILTIDASGRLSGKMSCNCVIAATLTPRADGKAYIANLAMGEGNHALSNKTFTGSAYLDPQQHRLYIVGNIVGSNEAAIYVGSKS